MLYPASPWMIALFLAGIAIVSYLFGSVNFAIVWTRVFLHDDIRKYGSGNAGMTNVLRTVGKGAAALTLLGDIAKGVLSVLVAQLVFTLLIPDPFFCVLAKYLAAFGALMGHLFPLYYGFKGGKGGGGQRRSYADAGALGVFVLPGGVSACSGAHPVCVFGKHFVCGGLPGVYLPLRLFLDPPSLLGVGDGLCGGAGDYRHRHAPRKHRPFDSRNRAENRRKKGKITV